LADATAALGPPERRAAEPCDPARLHASRPLAAARPKVCAARPTGNSPLARAGCNARRAPPGSQAAPGEPQRRAAGL